MINTRGMSTHIRVWAVITPGSPDPADPGLLSPLPLYTGRAAILSISTAIPEIPTHKLHVSHALQGHSCSLVPHTAPHTHYAYNRKHGVVFRRAAIYIHVHVYTCTCIYMYYNRKHGVVFHRAAIPLISILLEQTSCLLHYYMYNTTCVRKFLYSLKPNYMYILPHYLVKRCCQYTHKHTPYMLKQKQTHFIFVHVQVNVDATKHYFTFCR